jgi:ABC-type multidrug transport system fused ATPase/permease subunit
VNSLDDTPTVLYTEFVKNLYTPALKEALGEDYYAIREDIKRLKDQEVDEGSFECLKNVIDNRTSFEKGGDTLHAGWDIGAGANGSKLTLSQRMRISIARALVRKPHILLMHESTGKLDEEDYTKVQASIDGARANRTTIISSHNLETI